MDLLSRFHQKNRYFIIALLYHDIFDYPLSAEDFPKWLPNSKAILKEKPTITFSNGFYMLEGKEHLAAKRKKAEKISIQKLFLAQKAAKILAFLPSIQMVGLTGSLAMKNARAGSDIDMLLITKNQNLWTTRILAYFMLKFFGISVRKAGEREEKNKLCLNMWMDESDLYFNKQNIFTAHEVAQIVPLINKNHSFERLIHINKWIYDYWPNAVAHKRVGKRKVSKSMLSVVEPIAYQLQILYMKNKRSREVVTPTRAFFHPFDWGENVLKELKKRGIPSSTGKN